MEGASCFNHEVVSSSHVIDLKKKKKNPSPTQKKRKWEDIVLSPTHLPNTFNYLSVSTKRVHAKAHT